MWLQLHVSINLTFGDTVCHQLIHEEEKEHLIKCGVNVCASLTIPVNAVS